MILNIFSNADMTMGFLQQLFSYLTFSNISNFLQALAEIAPVKTILALFA